MKSDSYFEFEDRFRGPRQEIKSRLSSYDGLINYILNNIDNPKVLDIGSGRGEWLEKCREMGLESIGIENNNQMISLCEDKGLKIIPGNALETIEQFETECFSIISAFHFIEHISYENILKLLEECRRILKPKGVLILETPSIDNLQVASRTFYLDPTHINPINPDAMIFILEKSGFIKAKYYYINADDFDENNITRILSGSGRDICFIASKDESKNIDIFTKERSWVSTFNLSKSTMEIASLYDHYFKDQALKLSALEKQIEYVNYRQDKIFNNIIFRIYRKIKYIQKKIFNIFKYILKNNIFFIFRFILRNITSRISFVLLKIIYKILQIFRLNASSSKLRNTISKANQAIKKSSDSNNKLIDIYHSSNIAQKIYEQIKFK
tara:strand:- start:17 stop:1165 length:1149 start_codon:yes stop_codon:yes gene_type:complete